MDLIKHVLPILVHLLVDSWWISELTFRFNCVDSHAQNNAALWRRENAIYKKSYNTNYHVQKAMCKF